MEIPECFHGWMGMAGNVYCVDGCVQEEVQEYCGWVEVSGSMKVGGSGWR